MTSKYKVGDIIIWQNPYKSTRKQSRYLILGITDGEYELELLNAGEIPWQGWDTKQRVEKFSRRFSKLDEVMK